MSNYAIEVRNLTRKFGSFTAVNNLSFQIERGDIFGFLGPNGAGKSTTIRMLCGLLKPSSGSGTVGEFDIMNQSEQIKKTIGYMSQKFSLYTDLTAGENMDFFAGVYGVPRRKAETKKAELLDLMKMTDRRDEKTSLLTGGWRQRLALACALIHEPPIIFLDEPTSGVDPISRRDFWTIIQALSRRGITVLVTTHYMEEAEYCRKLALISAGTLIASATPAQLKETFEYDIFYVDCPGPVAAMELLQKENLFEDVSLWNRGLHVVVPKGSGGKEKIADALKKNALVPFRIEKARVSLEDVFVYKVVKEK